MRGLHCLAVGLAGGWWLAGRSGRRTALWPPRTAPQFDFLAVLSHELKTPLNIIGGYLELLEDDIPEPLPPTARAHVHQARLASRRMTELVNDLLTWARLCSGAVRATPEPTTAGHVARDACRGLSDQARGEGIALETRVPEGLTLRTDPAKASHALRALVANGIEFTDAGSVRVSAEREDGHVRFRVRDTGVGIGRANLERIFTPFWQLDSGVRRTHGGLGLGLAVSRRLARLLGGDVTVRSVPGAGSEFVLDLPDG